MRKFCPPVFLEFFFIWQVALIWKGWRKPLTENDIKVDLKTYKTNKISHIIEKSWINELNFSKKPSLIRALLKTFGLQFALIASILFALKIAIMILDTELLRQLILLHNPNNLENNFSKKVIFISIIALSNTLNALIYNGVFLYLTLLDLKIRVAVTTLLYRKILNTEKRQNEENSTGYTLNMFSNEMTRLDDIATYLQYVLEAFITIFAGIIYLTLVIGNYALFGFGFVLIYSIIQGYMFNKFDKLSESMYTKSDERVQYTSNIISGIQVIKMQAWEDSFQKILLTKRDEEMEIISKKNCLKMISSVFTYYYDKICIILNIGLAVIFGVPITADLIFVITNIYQEFKYACFISMPYILGVVSEAMTSITRFEYFLLKNYEGKINMELTTFQDEMQIGVEIADATFSYNSKIIFENLNLRVLLGESAAITGISGCGKTTLLFLLLKQLKPNEGVVKVKGTISYSSQEAWLFPGTVKENILFGQELNQQKYDQVIEICGLEHDLEVFPFGDNSLVGEKGLMLSGGQKTRINLARAVYRDADIYLLDDPFSAVDVHLAQVIFRKCILGYLKDKCVILVTHQLQFAQQLNRAFVIKDQQLCLMNINNMKFENESSYSRDVNRKTQKKERDKEEIRDDSLKTYINYFSMGGRNLFLFIFLFLIILSIFLIYCQSYALSAWIDVKNANQIKFLTFVVNFSDFGFVGFTLSLLAISAIILFFAASLLIRWCCYVFKNVHKIMLNKILQSPMKFFIEQSSGRILNRFSKDLGIIDSFTPILTQDVILYLAELVVCFIILCVSNYWMMLPTTVLSCCFIFFICLIKPVRQSLKKIEATRLSPILTHVTSTAQGIATIKSSNSMDIMEEKFFELQDDYTSATYLNKQVERAFFFWTQLLCCLYSTFGVSFVVVLSSNLGLGNFELAMTQVLQILYWETFMQTWVAFDKNMVSMGRVLEFMNLPTETTRGNEVLNGSIQGNITFEGVSMKYGSKKFALEDVSFQINNNEKVGIVGRSGAGKTSLIAALFRLYNYEGVITIDGIDIKTLSLKSLRSNIVIIPQDPILFSGTLRKNLDPFEECSDAHLWLHLKKINPEETFANVNLTLDTIVSEGGCNFSVGQRQLLCLVRAILLKRKIVVLDEATSNVDPQSDLFIQSLVQENFKDCTLLIIAHRLSTVLQCDKILVMKDANSVEFDTLENLKAKEGGIFKNMVDLIM